MRAIEKGATYLDKLCHKLYDEPKGYWALIDIEKNGQWTGIPFAVWAENGANFTYNIEGRELHCFRRPPSGEEDT